MCVNPSEFEFQGTIFKFIKRNKISSLPVYVLHKGDVTWDDSQRLFLAQHSVAMLEQCCNHSKQCRNNVAMLCCAKSRRCKSPRVTSPSNTKLGFFTSYSRKNGKEMYKKCVMHLQSCCFAY